MATQHSSKYHHIKFQVIWTKGSKSNKIHKSKHAQTSSYKAQNHASTSSKHKTELAQDMDIKPTPWHTSRCLEYMCKISGPSNKQQEFHKSFKIITHKKSTIGQSAKKISNKLEMHSKNPQKFTLKLNIQKSQHAKIQIILSSYGMVKKFHKLDKKWCDTNCHTSNDQVISHKPEMQKSQTLYQNAPKGV